jgi:membrane-associated protease RseP (regulator of RpoE activity)
MSTPTVTRLTPRVVTLDPDTLESTRPDPWRGVPLSIALFFATFACTTYAGYVASVAPILDAWKLRHLERVLADPGLLVLGLPFSLALLSILGAHELGHYVACRWHRVDASPPYFIPAPTLVGTFGAFIRIRGPLLTRRILFDVGAAGPLAGFVVTLAYLALGIATLDPARLGGGSPDFGLPWIMSAGLRVVLGHVPSPFPLPSHPVLFAAWVGCFITALNLLPVGQLDGGHVLSAMVGRWSRLVSYATLGGLVVLLVTTGWPGWIVWIVLLLVLGLRHPPVPDTRPLDRARVLLGCACFVVLLLTFIPAPLP